MARRDDLIKEVLKHLGEAEDYMRGVINESAANKQASMTEVLRSLYDLHDELNSELTED